MFKFLKPVLCKEKKEVMKEHSIYENKLDGVRIQIHIGKDSIMFFNQKGRRIKSDFVEVLKNNISKNTILDGVLMKDRRIAIFDILYFNDIDLRNYILAERKIILNIAMKNIKEKTNCIFVTDIFQITKNLVQHLKDSLKEGYKGIIIKNIDSRYTSHWVIMREFMTYDLVMLGGWIGCNGLVSKYLVGYFDERKKTYIGVCSVYNGLNISDIHKWHTLPWNDRNEYNIKYSKMPTHFINPLIAPVFRIKCKCLYFKGKFLSMKAPRVISERNKGGWDCINPQIQRYLRL